MPKRYNRCAWLYIKAHNTCGKSCINDFCSVHRAKIRAGSIIPAPCRRCGAGCQTQSRLCVDCKSNLIHRKTAYHGVQTRRRFTKLMTDLLQNAINLRHCETVLHTKCVVFTLTPGN